MALAFINDSKLYVSYSSYIKEIENINIWSEDEFFHVQFNGDIVDVFTSRNDYQIKLKPSTFFIDSEGNTWCNGDPTRFLSLGRGPIYNDEIVNGFTTWGKVITDTQFKKIECGNYFTIALDIEGHLWVCGDVYNTFKINKSGLFSRLSTETKFVDVSAGGDFFVAIAEDGSIWGQGTGLKGNNMVLGRGKLPTSAVNKLELVCEGNFVAVSCSEIHTICLSDDGDVWGAGSNENRALGFANVKNVPFFTQISTGAKVVSIAASINNTLCLLDDGRLFACGTNWDKQLGPDPRDRIAGEFLQIVINGNQFFDQISTITSRVVVKDLDGQLWIAGSTPTHDFMKVKTIPPILFDNRVRTDLPHRTITQRDKRFMTTKSAKNYLRV